MLEKELEDATSSYDELLRLCTNRVLLDDVNDEFDRGHLLEPPAPCEIAPEDLGTPDRVLRVALQGRRADWTAAIRAASQIRQPSYSLKDFYDDVRVAFPELSLYTVVRQTALQGTADTSSGVSGKDEYRRTIGAMFAVYWLARIGIDGERGFSLGVDDEWSRRTARWPSASPSTARSTGRPYCNCSSTRASSKRMSLTRSEGFRFRPPQGDQRRFRPPQGDPRTLVSLPREQAQRLLALRPHRNAQAGCKCTSSVWWASWR